MRPQPEVISIGSYEWLVRPLTLAQVQAIEPILIANTKEMTGNVASAIAIVSIALKRDHAAAAETLSDIEATASEIGRAMTAILRLGGFIELRSGAVDAPGEIEADAPKSTGPSA